MIAAALNTVLGSVAGSEAWADAVSFSGADPVLPTRYRIGTAGAAALGAYGAAMAALRATQTGQRPEVNVDALDAAAALRGTTYLRINGKPGQKEANLSGFYRTADRWIYFHCNAPLHQQRLQAVLGMGSGMGIDRAEAARAAERWLAADLEQAVHEAGACAPVVRTPQEWQALPNTSWLAAEPLVEVRRIGAAPRRPLPDGPSPLHRLRVLDLTRVLAGPSCGRLLAEAGADVLKIVSPRYPDQAVHELETGYLKRRVEMDIDTQPGRAQFEALIDGCDVFVQGYRQGALAGLGYAPEDVAARSPGVVYVSLNAYGFTGPWRERRGFDTVVQSASGLAHVSGGAGVPRVLPVSALDYLAGYLMAFGVLAALQRRASEGGSYEVRVSLARACIWLDALGLQEASVLDLPNELPADRLAELLLEVPSPIGTMRRLRPIVRYSEALLNRLPPWTAPVASEPRWL